MSRINRDIYTSLDVNGPYIRIDTQPVSTTLDHNGNAVFTLDASTYYLTGDEAEIGDIDVLETDAVAPTDASLDNQTPGVPHTAKNDGFISYQWYEIDANSTPIGAVTKLTDSAVYTGTTTNTLTVKNVQSPGTHLNQYYCILDYIPNLTSGQYDTGNAVNDTVTSDTVTLNVRPFLTITENPQTVVTGINDRADFYTTATLSDTRTPWENYRLEYQWWEKDTLSVGDLPNIRLVDGDYEKRLSTEKTEETVVDKIQRTTLTESVSGGQAKKVGIPTEVTSVSVTFSGAEGGKGGDENVSTLGGLGGQGRDGTFKFSNSELTNINNSGGPLDYIISSGSKGNDGTEGTVATGGLGGLSFDQDIVNDLNDSIFGGKGGDSGPGGVSGSGAGGGAGSGLIRYDGSWIAIAGAGGGGGGASEGASGGAGLDAQPWQEFSGLYRTSEVQQATVVNYNPKAGTAQGGNVQDRIEYGIYIKSPSPISEVTTGVTYRVTVVWNNQEVISANSQFVEDSKGLYVKTGNVKYYASTHRGSQLGWCNDGDLTKICIRGEGEYANAFDVFASTDSSVSSILAFDGGNGTSKILGDGGGGGGAGGGSNEPKFGGSPGADPIPSDEVDVIFKVFNNSDIGDDYIEFVEKPWYGFGSLPTGNRRIRFSKGSPTTQTVRLKTGHVYDVYSNFEDGETLDQPARTSDTLRILQDLTPDANLREVIAGRSVGLSLTADAENIQTGNEDDFRDFIVSVSDGTFDVVPQTVRLDDDEILGKAIIRYTAPTSSINSVKSTGGEGGGSQYNSTSLIKQSEGLSRGQGAVNMTVVTEQPYNVLEEEIIKSTIIRNYSIRGAHPYTPYQETGFRSNLAINSNYIFSKRILCQVTVKDTGVSPVINAITSGPNTRYTTEADYIVTDDRDAIITVEQIRQDDDFAVLGGLNLNNGDITFEKSNLSSVKETRYYSFYSNKDIEVDIQMYGGKGVDNGPFSGGNGGWTYLRLNMIANTEYVIAGLDDVINTPFLFKKGQLLACVGGGGNANSEGPGGSGGGVGMDGENATNGGAGGVSPSSLTLNGILGSASANPQFPDTREPYADSKADIPFGGRTTSCSKGNLYYFGGQPTPCEDRGSAVKFATGNGTLVKNTKEINRGFKAGYNIFNTAGRTGGISLVAGRGGCGAQGGNADSKNQYGGGGGSGYIAPDLVTDIFVRSEGNALISDSSYTDSGKQGDGNDTLSSTRGGSSGPAKVILSLAEIPTRVLPEFIERPANPLLNVSEEDVVRESNFIPLPEIAAPPPTIPPNPRMSITSIVSKGFTGGDQTYTSFNDTSRINVLETGSVDINIKTEDIPPNVRFYWKVFRLPNSSGLYSDSDFDSVTGNFTTIKSGSEIVGTFNVSPNVDTQTDFIGGDQDWYVWIYSDSDFKYRISPETFTQKFRIKDNSLSAPVVTFDLINDQSIAPKVRNNVIEGVTRTVNVNTQNIENDDTIKWYIAHNGTTNLDFSATEGTITVTSGFTLDADGVAESRGGILATANLGSSSFTFTTIEDQSTEGVENFGFQIEYPVGSGNIITNTLTGSGDTKKTFNLSDTSLVPVAEFSTTTSSIDEGASFTFNLNTEHFFTGDTFFWKLLSATTDDFNAVTGEATVTETDDSSPSLRRGTASIKITTVPDSITEGPESYTLALYKDDSHTTNLNTVGNINHATTSFTINDTSLGPREFGGFIDGLVRGKTNEDDVGLIFFPQAWNLTAAVSDGVIYYWQVLRSDGTVPVTQSSWGAVGDDRTIEPEFNSVHGGITGQFTFTRAGYTKTKGSTSGGVSATTDSTFIFPYHTANTDYVSDDRVFSTIRDYLNDSDKSYYVAFYGSVTDRTNRTNALFETDTFTVTNSSPVYYAFNKSRGWGSTNITGANGNNPAIISEDNQIYYFRVETSAPVGTVLYYDTLGTGTAPADFDDFVRVNARSLPDPINDSVYIRDAQEGSITTYDIDFVGNTNPTVDSGKIRSIGYIPVIVLADEVTDGDKNFAVAVYTSAGRRSSDRVLIDTITIKDTSKTLLDSTVSLALSDKGKTSWSGSIDDTGKFYSIERQSGDKLGIRLSWTVTNAGNIEDYDYDGSGFDTSNYELTDFIAPGDTWYTSSGSDEGTISALTIPPGDDDDTTAYVFEMEVQRRRGVLETSNPPTKTDRITLTVKTIAPEAIPTATLDVDKTTITERDSIFLEWDSSDGESYSLTKQVNSGTPSTFVVEPGSSGSTTDTLNTAGTYKYVYTVTGRGGDVRNDEVLVTVELPDPPTVTLSASDTSVKQGGSTRLTWTTRGEALLNYGLAKYFPVSGGSRQIETINLEKLTANDSIEHIFGKFDQLGTYTFRYGARNSGGPAAASVDVELSAVDAPNPTISVDNTEPRIGDTVNVEYGGTQGTYALASGKVKFKKDGYTFVLKDPAGTSGDHAHDTNGLSSLVKTPGEAFYEFELKDTQGNPATASAKVTFKDAEVVEPPTEKCEDPRAVNNGQDGACIFTTYNFAHPLHRYIRSGSGGKLRFAHHTFGPGVRIGGGWGPPSHTSGDAHGITDPLFYKNELRLESYTYNSDAANGGGYQLPSHYSLGTYQDDVKDQISKAKNWTKTQWETIWKWHWGRAWIRYTGRDVNTGDFRDYRYDEFLCGVFRNGDHPPAGPTSVGGVTKGGAYVLNTNLALAMRCGDRTDICTPDGGRRPGGIKFSGTYHGLDDSKGYKFWGWTNHAGNPYEFGNRITANDPVLNPDWDNNFDPNRWPFVSSALETERHPDKYTPEKGIPHHQVMEERFVIVADEVLDRSEAPGLGSKIDTIGSGQHRFLSRLHNAELSKYVDMLAKPKETLNDTLFPDTIGGNDKGKIGLNNHNRVKIDKYDQENFSQFPKITWTMPHPYGIYHYLADEEISKFYDFEQTNLGSDLPDWHPYYDASETDNNLTIRTIKDHLN